MSWRIELGDKVKDVITGQVGIATGRTEYLYGCRHVYLKPTELKDGKPVDGVWLDEGQVEVVERVVIKPRPSEVLRRGGPSLAPPSRG